MWEENQKMKWQVVAKDNGVAVDQFKTRQEARDYWRGLCSKHIFRVEKIKKEEKP